MSPPLAWPFRRLSRSISPPPSLDRLSGCFAVRAKAEREMSSIRSLISREEAVNRWQGILFVVVGFVFLLLFLYAAIISKLLPPSENAFLSAIQNDWYYCLLVPLTLPILYVAIYFHWLSMKLFKHA